MKPTRWRVWLSAATIFFLGAGCGVAGTTLIALRRLREWAQAPASAPSLADRVTNRLTSQLTSELDLTPEESARVEATLDATAVNLKQARVRFTREVASELRASLVRIAQDLPPQKRAEFRQVVRARFLRMGVDLSETDEPTAPSR